MKNAKPVKQPVTIAQAVDRAGQIKIEINRLHAEYEKLKAGFIAGGAQTYDGEIYRVQLTETERSTLDMKAVREKLSPQFIQAHSKITHVTQMHVTHKESATNIIPIK